MNFYSLVVFLHVLTAILGLGPLTVLAIVSTGPATASFSLDRVTQFMRLVGWSLAGMFVTGAMAIAFTRGALGQTGWMRVSFGLFLLLGILHGLARRRIKKTREAHLPVQGLSPLLWSMCAVVAAITYLMEAKPW